MTIYTSEKVMPYVYMGVHKETGEFYFGSRWANTGPSTHDLGVSYFTSSTKIKPRFSEFDWQIVAEFFDKDAAFAHEQLLIQTHWDNPLCSNGNYKTSSHNYFKCSGHTEKTRKLLSERKKGSTPWNKGKRMVLTEKMIAAADRRKSQTISTEHKRLISEKLTGIKRGEMSEGHKQAIKSVKDNTRKLRLARDKEIAIAHIFTYIQIYGQLPTLNHWASVYKTHQWLSHTKVIACFGKWSSLLDYFKTASTL